MVKCDVGYFPNRSLGAFVAKEIKKVCDRFSYPGSESLSVTVRLVNGEPQMNIKGDSSEGAAKAAQRLQEEFKNAMATGTAEYLKNQLGGMLR